jgi:hypothetical protein
MQVLDGLPVVEKTSLFGTAVHAVLRDRSVDAEAIAGELRKADVPVTEVTPVPPSLEDVFLDIVERAGTS